ncbi:hypothetical protein Tco_1378122 [Tanacetum coccineum]
MKLTTLSTGLTYKQLYKGFSMRRRKADKILLYTYWRYSQQLKDLRWADDDEEPSAGSDRGSKRRRSGKEPASTSAPSETTTKTAGKTTSTGTKTHTKSASQSAPVGKLCTQRVFKGPADQEFETGVQDEQAEEEIYGHIKWIEDLVPNSMWSQTIVKYDKFALWGVSHWGKKRRQFYAFAALRESARDVYSKRRIIAVTKVEIVEWHDYKHLDWITVRRDDDVLYDEKYKSSSVEERIAFNVSLRMFTQSVVIQRRVEDLQLGVESYQKKLNLTKPDTYRSNLRRQDAYTPYSDPRGFIYENKDKKNRLMRIDELHKFSDGTLDDVRTALNDSLKGIRMEYLPQTFWSQRDKANAGAMIQAITKGLKTRRNNEEFGEICRWTTIRGYKAVRLRFSDPMIQPEPEGSTQGYPLDSVEVLRFNTSAGNPVKKILLKLNLSDHRLFKMVVEVPDSSWLTRSIATCSYPTDKHKDIMKAQITSILHTFASMTYPSFPISKDVMVVPAIGVNDLQIRN